ncbi:MAG: phosphate ABC transporter permease PstA [Clostridia bacterium]|nr:phosphate ABC transporter permease PstA [Clostridia bacterium]
MTTFVKLKDKMTKENVARAIFAAFAAFSILAVFAIVFFLLYKSFPAFRQIGFFNFLFGGTWSPTNPSLDVPDRFGILPMIAGSVVLTLTSVSLGGVLAIFTAVFIVYYCPKKIKPVFNQLVNLLAGIPSIVYGYFGLTFLMPLLVQLFHVPQAYGLVSSTVILSIMLVPTIASITKNSLESVPMNYYEGALALGCTKNQTVFKVCLPAAKNGILAAMILGVGRAVGETMAVQFLVGSGDNYPGLFLPFRTMTSSIVLEMGYADEILHKPALIAIGFILLLFILAINLCLAAVKRNNSISGNKLFNRKIRESENAVSHYSWHKTGSLQDVLWILSCAVSLLVALSLLFIVFFVLIKGVSGLDFNFLFGKSGNAQVTLAPAFLSTGMVILLSLAISLPLGIGAAIFLSEYAKKGSRFVKTINLFIDTLSGVPSVVFGLFGMVFFGNILHIGINLLNGSLTLSLIVLPTIIRSTEQSLTEVPDSMREASYALGASKVRTIFKVVLPQALSGMITSVILSVGRIVSESAALIYTAGAVAYMPQSYLSRGATLSVMMWFFNSADGIENAPSKCFATAAILIVLVLILNILVTVVEKYFRKRSNK